MISEQNYQTWLRDLDKAVNFFDEGERNKSRVLARQIAGKAIREILRLIDSDGSKYSHLNPYQCLEEAIKEPEVFKEVFAELEALTTRVNPDYSFPEDLDLINSTKIIITFAKKFKGTYG